MGIPKVSQGDILRALQYIDENGIPDKNKSVRYFLIGEGGKTYEKNVRAREDICVIKLGIHVPGSVEPYEKFVSDMKAAENIFKQTIKMRMKM